MYGTSYAVSSYVIVEPEYLQSNVTPTIGYYAQLPEPSPYPQNQAGDNTGEVLYESRSAALEPEESSENIVLLPVVGGHGNSDQTEEDASARSINVEEMIQRQEADLLPVDADVAILFPTSTPTPLPTQAVLEQENEQGSQTEQRELETPAVSPQEPQPEPVSPTPQPEPVKSEPSQPIVRLKIPRLKVERAVVEIGAHPEKGWDTDSLFATKNRSDLVGHLEGSALPGEGSNIVLAGHNYDWGIFQWNGVFYNLRQLKPGDKIFVFTQGGERHTYFVNQVKEIPFKSGSEEELFKHAKHLGPTESERLTLVTCSGANLLNWNKRVYVIAYPE